MQKHPNQYLNEFVALFFLSYLKLSGYKRTGTYINNAVWDFFEQSEIDPTTNLNDLSDLAHQAAIIQRRLVMEQKHKDVSLRSVRHEYPQLLPVISHGPSAWLINTYRPLLTNLLAVDLGQMQYGISKDCYRIIQENVMASRMMFEIASNSIANELAKIYAGTPNLGLFEGGAGNGAAMLTNLQVFHKLGIQPDFLISDKDLATREVAEKYFREHGFPSKHFPWKQVDIGRPKDLAKVADYFSWHNLVVNVNYIVHEHEPIAQKFFSSMSKSLPKADLVISEFFPPADYTNIGPDFPHWFVALHSISQQTLRPFDKFMKYPSKYGYKIFHQIDHQKYNGIPINSTLFLRKI